MIPRNNNNDSPRSRALLNWRRKIYINLLRLIKQCMHLAVRALHLRCTLNPQLLYHLLMLLLVLLKLLLLRLLTSASAETTLLRLSAALPGSSTSGSNSWTLPFRKGTSDLPMAHLAAVETTAR